MNAIVFPGQGAQYTGMGRSFYDGSGRGREIFDLVDETLGWELSRICFHGPEEKLKPASVQELAVLTVSLAAYETFKEKNIKIDFLSGLSLGECTCLYPAGVLNLKDLVLYVKERSNAMEEAAKANPSSMCAVIGLDRKHLEKKGREEGFYLSNINSPRQTVISLKKEDAERIKNVLKGSGAKKVVELEVSGGFHSPLMEPAKSQLEKAAGSFTFKETQVPIISNVTARAHTSGEEIKNNLLEQLTSPVLWQDCVEFMIKNGVEVFFEIGPSQILRRLIKRINPKVKVINIGGK